MSTLWVLGWANREESTSDIISKSIPKSGIADIVVSAIQFVFIQFLFKYPDQI